MKKLRMALIGAGQIAQVTHIPNYQKMSEVEIVGICDARLEQAEAAARKWKIPHYYQNHEEMIAAQKPDAVTVCVPNKFHSSITMDAIARGCHVLCEKPPAMSAREAQLMEAAAAEQKVLLSYGFHFRHGNEVKLLKDKIKSGELGVIYGARVQWLRRRGIPGWGNFTNRALQGGGPLIDIGAHMLDLALYLMDYPELAYVCANTNQYLGKSASAGLMGAWDRNKFEVEDSLFGYIHFKNGHSMSIETSFALNIKERDVRNVQLFGEKAGASLFPLEVFGEEKGQLTNMSYPYIEECDRHYACARNFVQACRGEAPLLISAQQGTYVQQVIQSLYDSAETGMPVIIK